MKLRSLLALGILAAFAACTPRSSSQPPQQPQYQPPPYYGQPQPYPNQPPPYPGQPPHPPQPPNTPAQRPLLAPLVGVAAMQQEVVSILAELIAALPGNQQQLVSGIPFQFDPTFEVNAFAGCDEQGRPYMAATAGILEAVDAIAQTKATDEMFGTKTYDAYANAVMPAMVRSEKGRAALPPGIIPTQYGGDARRWSRAREIFDNTIAFTLGHELAHHYLGHTGCAKGQPMGLPPAVANLGRLLTNIPTFNQVAEANSDTAGCENTLNAGRRRRPNFEWTEYGGVTLLDYFARLNAAAGAGGLGSLLSPVAFLRSHPNPLARIPLVQITAQNWRARNPG